MFALSLLQNQLLNIFIFKDACILSKEVICIHLVIVLAIIFMLQRFFRGNFIVDNFSLLFLLFTFSWTHSLIDAITDKRSLSLTWTTHIVILFTLSAHFRSILMLSIVLLCLVFMSWLKVIVISRKIFVYRLSGKHHRGVILQFLGVVKEFNRKFVILFIVCKLFLT